MASVPARLSRARRDRVIHSTTSDGSGRADTLEGVSVSIRGSRMEHKDPARCHERDLCSWRSEVGEPGSFPLDAIKCRD